MRIWIICKNKENQQEALVSILSLNLLINRDLIAEENMWAVLNELKSCQDFIIQFDCTHLLSFVVVQYNCRGVPQPKLEKEEIP